MAFARQNLNLVLLPTGEVLATSGTAPWHGGSTT